MGENKDAVLINAVLKVSQLEIRLQRLECGMKLLAEEVERIVNQVSGSACATQGEGK